jgi:hypothetical protein
MSFQFVPCEESLSAPKRTPTNRRAYVRYRCGPATSGRLMVVEGHEWQRAWIIDLSLGGAGLLLSRALEPGLSLVLHLRSTSQNKTYELPAHVAHASRQPDGDWVIGCEFEQQLTDDLLDTLL